MKQGIILFMSGGQIFVMNLADVTEVVESPQTYRIPFAPDYMSDGLLFHGDLVPAADPGPFFGRSASRGGTYIVMDRRIGNLALRAEKIIDVFPPKEVKEGEDPVPAEEPVLPEEVIVIKPEDIFILLEKRLTGGG